MSNEKEAHDAQWVRLGNSYHEEGKVPVSEMLTRLVQLGEITEMATEGAEATVLNFNDRRYKKIPGAVMYERLVELKEITPVVEIIVQTANGEFRVYLEKNEYVQRLQQRIEADEGTPIRMQELLNMDTGCEIGPEEVIPSPVFLMINKNKGLVWSDSPNLFTNSRDNGSTIINMRHGPNFHTFTTALMDEEHTIRLELTNRKLDGSECCWYNNTISVGLACKENDKKVFVTHERLVVSGKCWVDLTINLTERTIRYRIKHENRKSNPPIERDILRDIRCEEQLYVAVEMYRKSQEVQLS